EAEMSGQRGRLRPDAFHQAAVAAYREDIVIEDVEPRLVIACTKKLSRDRHADTGGYPLAQRSCGGFHSGRKMIFGMPRRLAAELAEVTDIVERHRRPAQ